MCCLVILVPVNSLLCLLTLGPAGVSRGEEGGGPPGRSPPPTTSTHKFRVPPQVLLRTGPVLHPSPWAPLGPSRAPWPWDPWLQVGVSEPPSSGPRLSASLPNPVNHPAPPPAFQSREETALKRGSGTRKAAEGGAGVLLKCLLQALPSL